MQGTGLTIMSNLGFSVLLKDISTHGQEEPGIKPPTLWLVDKPALAHEPQPSPEFSVDVRCFELCCMSRLKYLNNYYINSH